MPCHGRWKMEYGNEGGRHDVDADEEGDGDADKDANVDEEGDEEGVTWRLIYWL
jgi:hypothetical protein